LARPSKSAKISVVIVTYNRNRDCREAVISVFNQRKPPHEVMVGEDLSRVPFQCAGGKILRNEMERGLAACRNLGINLATGDIIAFIDDDDAVAPPNWIEKLQETFILNDADVIGGPCKPLYLSQSPEWWDEKLFGAYVGINYRGIIGCNFAVKKKRLIKLGILTKD